MQNYKKYGIPNAQLVIADVPYKLETNFEKVRNNDEDIY